MATTAKYREIILNGPLIRTILWLSWPPIVASITNISYNFVDTLWLSRLGAAEMAAPRQVLFILWILISIGMGLSSGNTAIISQYVGANDLEKALDNARQLLVLIFAWFT